MRWLFSILFFLCFAAVNAQNLIPNPSFEILDSCPFNSNGDVGHSRFWTDPNKVSSDVFSTCVGPNHDFSSMTQNWKGYQLPRTGENYGGAHVFWKQSSTSKWEHMEVELIDSMIPNTKYFLSYYISLAEKSNYYIEKLGVHFSDTLVLNSGVSLTYLEAQAVSESGKFFDNMDEWVRITDTVILEKAAKFMVVGNFNDASNTSDQRVIHYTGPAQGPAYYYYDDFELYRVKPQIALNNPQDSIPNDNFHICIGDSVKLAARLTDSTAWAKSSTSGTIFSTSKSIVVSPEETTTYILYTKLDTIEQTIYVDTVFPKINLADTTLICMGEEGTFDIAGSGDAYLWSDSSTSAFISLADSGNYWVEVSLGACTSEKEFTTTKEPCELIIPNIITPNDDGKNDWFTIVNPDQRSIKLHVYSRWGKLVYSSDDYAGNWQAEGLSDGLYFYRASTAKSGEYQGWIEVRR